MSYFYSCMGDEDRAYNNILTSRNMLQKLLTQSKDDSLREILYSTTFNALKTIPSL